MVKAPVVIASDITKHFGNLTAVDCIHFKILSGQCFGLLGPNGAGKSTLIRILYGASPREKGVLSVLGLDPQTHARELKKYVGVVTQDNALDDAMTVRENMLLYASFYELSGKEKKIDELLEWMSLSHKGSSRIRELSGGMKRRLVFVRALLNSPKLLILDEPTTGLDPAVRQLLWEKIRLLRTQGTTILLTTHYMDEAEVLCDRIVIMDQGQLKEEGSPRELIKKHCAGYVALVDEKEQSVSSQRIESSSIETLLNDLKTRNIQPSVIRPSNLEDVFLHITGKEISSDA